MTSQLVFLYRHQRRSPRRWWALLVVLLVALAGFATAQAAPVCTTNGNQGTCTFTYTGAAERWVVPPHATQATFDLYGAQGGGRYAGGRGGRATASLLLTPGAVYQITVGGEGGELTGGFNGGGQGGGVPGSNPASGGGGASDIRTGNFGLADRILVAGGGGGSGHCCASSDGVEGGAGAIQAVGMVKPAKPGRVCPCLAVVVAANSTVYRPAAPVLATALTAMLVLVAMAAAPLVTIAAAAVAAMSM